MVSATVSVTDFWRVTLEEKAARGAVVFAVVRMTDDEMVTTRRAADSVRKDIFLLGFCVLVVARFN